MNGKLMVAVAAFATLIVSCKDGKTETAYDGPAVKAVIFPGDYPDPSILRDGNDF